MYLSVDIETQGLDARRFLLGAVCSGELTVAFRDKEDLLGYIMSIAEKEACRGHNLYVYAHHSEFDTAGLLDYRDKNIEWFSFSPPIQIQHVHVTNRNGKQKSQKIYWLDSHAIFRMPLREVGNAIGYEKMALPEYLREMRDSDGDVDWSAQDLQILEDYCKVDAEVVWRGITMVQKTLNTRGRAPRKLLTVGNIAIKDFLCHLRDFKHKDCIFEDEKRGSFKECNQKERVHKGYRGPRVEAFQYGGHKDVHHLDINSLYPYIGSTMDFPDLGTERFLSNPLSWWSQKELFNEMGVSRCVLVLPEDSLGMVPVRVDRHQVFPKHVCKVTGSWTHTELKRFIEAGVEVKEVRESVIYCRLKENPLKDWFLPLYEAKKNAETPFDRMFYKMLMNNLVGKFAQRYDDFEIRVDDVEVFPKLSESGWYIGNMLGEQYLYKRKKGIRFPRWYCPMVAAELLGRAKLHLYDELCKIPTEDLLYTDTDSAIFTGGYNQGLFKIGDGMGEWKVEHENTDINIRGKKMYRIGDTVVLSGTPKDRIKYADFESGVICDKRMLTIRTAPDVSMIGAFIPRTMYIGDKTKEEVAFKRYIANTGAFMDAMEIKEVREGWNRRRNL